MTSSASICKIDQASNPPSLYGGDGQIQHGDHRAAPLAPQVVQRSERLGQVLQKEEEPGKAADQGPGGLRTHLCAFM